MASVADYNYSVKKKSSYRWHIYVRGKHPQTQSKLPDFVKEIIKTISLTNRKEWCKYERMVHMDYGDFLHYDKF